MQFNDPDIIRLAKAIRRKESGDNPNPKSQITRTEGSKGYYQFMPDTFTTYGQRYLGGKDLNGNALDINNPDHQNLVAYKYIEDKKKQGYGIDQIAASWNAGEGAIEDYKGRVGTNKYGNKYNVPAYVDEVTHMYNELKSKDGNPDYEEVAYDPSIHSTEAKQKDAYYLEELQKRGQARDDEYQAIKDYDTGSPSLNYIKDVSAGFKRGIENESARYLDKAGSSINSLVKVAGFEGSTNPALNTGSQTNEFMTNEDGNGFFNSEDTSEKVGEWVGWGARQAAFLKGAGTLQKGAEASILGKFGAGSGFLGNAARYIPAEMAGAVPFIADQAVNEQDVTAGNVTLGVGLALAFGAGRGAWAKYLGEDLIAKAVALKTLGKMDEFEKLVNSTAYKSNLIKKGLATTEGQAAKVAEETAKVRNLLPDVLPKKFSLGVNDVNSPNYISDEALKAFLGVSDAKITEGNLLDMTDTLKRVTAREKEVLFPSKEAIKDGAIGIDQVAEAISKNRTNPAANINVEQMKTDIINGIKNSSMVNKEKTIRFVEREMDDVGSQGQEKVFQRLHEKRKALNEDFAENGDNDATFLANQIRNKVKEYEADPAVGFYMKLNKEYETLQSVKKVATALHRTNIKKGIGGQMLPLLFGYTAGSMGGGIISPALFYAGTRVGQKVQSGLLNKFMVGRAAKKTLGGEATKLTSEQSQLANEMKRITGEMGEQEIKAGVSEVKKQIIRAERNLTPKNLNEVFDLLAKNKDVPIDDKLLSRVDDLVKRMEKQKGTEKTAKILNDFLNEPYKENLPTIQMGKGAKSKYTTQDPNLPVANDVPPATYSEKAPTQGVEPYTPDSELPVIDAGTGGKTKGEVIMEKLKKSSKGLPTIMSLLGLGYAATPDSTEAKPNEPTVIDEVTQPAWEWSKQMPKIEDKDFKDYDGIIKKAVADTGMSPEEMKALLMVESDLGRNRNRKGEAGIYDYSPFADITGVEKATYKDFIKRNPEYKDVNVKTLKGMFEIAARIFEDKKSISDSTGAETSKQDSYDSYKSFTSTLKGDEAKKEMKAKKFELAYDYVVKATNPSLWGKLTMDARQKEAEKANTLNYNDQLLSMLQTRK